MLITISVPKFEISKMTEDETVASWNNSGAKHWKDKKLEKRK